MAINNNEIRVAANGAVYVAAKGTALPVDLAVPPAAWKEVGAINEDGATIARSTDQENIMIWQSSSPARVLVTSTELTIAMVLMQYNDITLPLYFGGGTVTETTPGTLYKYNVPSTASGDERALLIDAFDGTTTHRYLFPRVQVSETEDLALKRTEASGLGVTFSVLAPADGSALAIILSNDANLAVVP